MPEETHQEQTAQGFWAHHRLIMLLIGTISMALVLTCVSVIIYTTSGAAQLDLSRPGYRSGRALSPQGQDSEQYVQADQHRHLGPVGLRIGRR